MEGAIATDPVDPGRQTLILARVSRHFIAERCAEWRFTVGYAGEVAKKYDNERLDPASV